MGGVERSCLGIPLLFALASSRLTSPLGRGAEPQARRQPIQDGGDCLDIRADDNRKSRPPLQGLIPWRAFFTGTVPVGPVLVSCTITSPSLAQAKWGTLGASVKKVPAGKAWSLLSSQVSPRPK